MSTVHIGRRVVLAAAMSTALLAGCASNPVEPPPARDSLRMPSITKQQPPPASTSAAKPGSSIPPQGGRVVAKTCANCPTPDPDFAPHPDEIPKDVADVPDAVPIDEPRSKYGNPDSYDALGQHYTIFQQTPKGYREKGRASWYGKKFHGLRTANGEAYDMFKMTAAHKTLPLPSYARVTNLENGRSVVVRINDRGPFHRGRIVDLSYAAAAKLDLLHHGSADVELEVLTPEAGSSAIDDSSGKPRWIEVGRFSDPIDAVALQERLRGLGFSEATLSTVRSASGDGQDQVLRIGPFSNFAKLEEARKKLGNQNITAIPLAN
jgi:rare lipoprotein A